MVGVVVDGDFLLEVDFNFQIDNMEVFVVYGIVVGDIILMLFLDDN